MAFRPHANLSLKLLALGIAFFLWLVAHGSSSIEKGFDLPVVLEGVPEKLVVVSLSADVVNVRVAGSRAALRNLVAANLEYRLDVSGARPGLAEYEVDRSRLQEQLPRGVKIVSRSPARIQVSFEPRASRTVRVRPDIEGEPAEGFRIARVLATPRRIRITGARSEVLRLSEVVTETVDVTGARAPVEKEVRISLPGDHVQVVGEKPVHVVVEVEPIEPPPEAGEQEG